MRNIKLPRVRLDKSNVDAPTINRALDTIVDALNPFIQDTVKNINDIETGVGGSVNINAGSGISVVEAPAGTYTITNTEPGTVQNVVGGTDIQVTESPVGTFTIDYTGTGGGVQNILAGTGISVVESPPDTFTITNTLPENTDILAGTGISVTESPAGTFTITNTGVPGPPGPAGASNPSGGVLYRRTSGNWNRVSVFGNVLSSIAASGTDPNGFPSLSIFPDMANTNTFYRSAVIFARILTQTGFTQTTPNTYTPSTPPNTGWRAFVSADFINFSALDFINEYSCKLSTYGTPVGDMEFWLYYY